MQFYSEMIYDKIKMTKAINCKKIFLLILYNLRFVIKTMGGVRMKSSRFLRIVATVLIIFTIALSLYSCNGGGSKNPITDPPSKENTEWSIGSSASFAVVTPKTPTSALSASLDALLSAFRDKTGVRPETKTDEIKRGAIRDNTTYEILLGRTSYDQTAEVLSNLTEGQFAIVLSGRKLVITTPKDVDLSAAVDYFIENYINVMEQSNGASLLSTGSYISPAPEIVEKEITVNGVNIGNFDIVYESSRKGYREVAEYLQTVMKESGFTVSVYRDIDRTDSGTPEILVGKTNRAVSAQMYGSTPPDILTYRLGVQGNKVQIMGGGPFSAYQCVGQMRMRFFGANDPTYTNGTYLETDNSFSIGITEGTDVRLMTYNVLADRWAYPEEREVLPVSHRAEIIAGVLLACKPDAVGLQETDQAWIDALPAWLELLKTQYGIEYEWKFYNYLNKQTLTTILYRSDKYDLIDSGIENFSYWDNSAYVYNLRLIEWVNLREKADGTRSFILANTHWGFDEETEICLNESISRINALKEQYPGVRVFFCGDFNSNQTSEPFFTYQTETGSRDACTVAIEAGTRVNDTGGNRDPGKPRYEGGSYIDHIFGTGTWSVLRYETVLGISIYGSDHSPHYADIKF